jgi:hypothetical protein
MGGVVDHSSNIPDPVSLNSAEYEYNEACIACQSTSHLDMTLNELEQVETGGKYDKPIHLFLDNKLAVDISSTFKDTNSRGAS